jgi:glycerol-3-phosphate dehydrogenase
VAGRYGQEADELLSAITPEALAPIVPGLPMLWAELNWASCGEAVVHLDDLLLRRVRLGFVAPNGGLGELDRIRRVVQAGLGWSDETWEQEALRYQRIWTQSYSPALCG